MSGPAQEIALAKWLAAGLRCIGQISIEAKDDGTFALTHREDAPRNDLVPYAQADDAARLARFDDAGKYRPLKTAPNLRHGWRLMVPDRSALGIALDLFYPGRLAAFLAWETGSLVTTPLRETLQRQTGMYRLGGKDQRRRSEHARREIFAAPMADACARSFGNATGRGRSRRRSYLQKSSIRRMTRPVSAVR